MPSKSMCFNFIEILHVKMENNYNNENVNRKNQSENVLVYKCRYKISSIFIFLFYSFGMSNDTLTPLKASPCTVLSRWYTYFISAHDNKLFETINLGLVEAVDSTDCYLA